MLMLFLSMVPSGSAPSLLSSVYPRYFMKSISSWFSSTTFTLRLRLGYGERIIIGLAGRVTIFSFSCILANYLARFSAASFSSLRLPSSARLVFLTPS